MRRVKQKGFATDETLKKQKPSKHPPKTQKAGGTGLCYRKKAEARDRYAMAGVQFSGESIKDGLIYSIYDANSAVNQGGF